MGQQLVQTKEFIEKFFDEFLEDVSTEYGKDDVEKIDISLFYIKSLYEMTALESSIEIKSRNTIGDKKATEEENIDFFKGVADRIKNINRDVFELKRNIHEIINTLKEMYCFVGKNYTSLRGNEYGMMYDMWLESGHISGGLKNKENKEEKYKNEIYKAFLVDWKDGEYDGDKSYLRVIEDIKEQNNVGTILAKKMYKEASKVRKRIKKKVR